jgi:hypothetical protein
MRRAFPAKKAARSSPAPETKKAIGLSGAASGVLAA